MIGIFLKGLNASKSTSPVMMHLACPERAASRNISSFGSLLIETRWAISINSISALYRARNFLRSPTLKYLSNLARLSTSFSSSYIKSELMIFPRLRALSNTWSCTDPLNSAALINTFVSITKFNYLSFSNCSSNSGVRPCFWAYLLMSSMTSRSVRVSSINRRTISLRPFLSSSLSLAKRSANSSDASSTIVFILQI